MKIKDKKNEHDMAVLFNINILLSLLSVKYGVRRLGRIECRSKWCVDACISSIKKLKLEYDIHKPDNEQWMGLKISPYTFVYFSNKSETIDRGIKLHHDHSTNYQGVRNRSLGKLYGYPACCIDFMLKNQDLAVTNDDVTSRGNELSKPGIHIVSKYTNCFTPIQPIFHQPHSFLCSQSIKIGKRNLELLKTHNKRLYLLALDNINCCLLSYCKKRLIFHKYTINQDIVLLASNEVNKALSTPNLNNKFWQHHLSQFQNNNTTAIGVNGVKKICILIFK